MPQSADAPTVDTPTVEILFEYAQHDAQGSWAWAPCRTSPRTREHVYTAQEMCHTMKTYGVVMARLIPPGKHTRWRVMARGIETGLARAEWVWEWDARAGCYRPIDTPWITWPTSEAEIPPRILEQARRLGYTGMEPRCRTCKSH